MRPSAENVSFIHWNEAPCWYSSPRRLVGPDDDGLGPDLGHGQRAPEPAVPVVPVVAHHHELAGGNLLRPEVVAGCPPDEAVAGSVLERGSQSLGQGLSADEDLFVPDLEGLGKSDDPLDEIASNPGNLKTVTSPRDRPLGRGRPKAGGGLKTIVCRRAGGRRSGVWPIRDES